MIPEICVKMIRRINDEEGIRKLVMDVFQNMWFAPLPRRPSPEDQELLITKARNITDVVVACRDTGLEWFEQLLETLFKPKENKEDATKKNIEPTIQLVLACQQIVDCLVESVLRMEESNCDLMTPEDAGAQNARGGASNRLVACLTTLFLFAKIRPQLLVEHVQTLSPYLSVTCRTQSDHQIISNVARTLELTVPLIKHPSEIFLSQLEEASVKLILLYRKEVVEACLSCLGSVVNEVTKNFKLIRDCFTQYYGWMKKFQLVHEENTSDTRLDAGLPKFRRAMFTVGLLLRHFDFSKEELYSGLAVSIYFLNV
jgi:cohesin loading factor subunit SCC2